MRELENLEWPAAIQRLGSSILIIGNARHVRSSCALSLSSPVLDIQHLAVWQVGRKQQVGNRHVSEGGFFLEGSRGLFQQSRGPKIFLGEKKNSKSQVVNSPDQKRRGFSLGKKDAGIRFALLLCLTHCFFSHVRVHSTDGHKQTLHPPVLGPPRRRQTGSNGIGYAVMVDIPCTLGIGLGLTHLTRRNRSATSPRREAIELVSTSPRAGVGTPDTAATAKAGAVWKNCSDDDEGEDRLLQDFGPGSCRAPGWAGSSFDSPTSRRLDRYITGEHGLRHRIVYEPTELARLLQPRLPKTGARWQLMANVFEAVLDPSRPRCESLLLCKAITDAYVVNRGVGVAGDGGDDAGDLLVQTLRQAWQHAVAVDHWDGYVDERRHRAVDLHLAASWFQAWEASDGSTSNQTMSGVSSKLAGTTPAFLPDVLPGDWVWVLDHLKDEGGGGASGCGDEDPEYSVKGYKLS